MVNNQLIARGILSARTLEAFLAVPRERFVLPDLEELAYEDGPLPIGFGQTISQPYIVAKTIEALGLRGDERVLEIGTGSAYEAALLSHIVAEVYTVERIEALASRAEDVLRKLSCSNVRVRCGDGSIGWIEEAPFDAIAVSASGPYAPPALVSQLADGGRLVMPIGHDRDSQWLVRISRNSDEFTDEFLEPVRFVPLIGSQAWPTTRA